MTPIIRSATSRICAEYPTQVEDTMWIAKCIDTGNDKIVSALPNICGALAIRIEDCPRISLEPWVRLLAALAPNLTDSNIAAVVRFLLSQFIEPTEDTELRSDLGLVARALLEYGYDLEEPGFVSAAIGFVADTYETDPSESCRLLSKVFDDRRLQNFGWEEVPAVCLKIEAIAAADPAFCKEIYHRTYTFDVREERKTRMGSSQILPLTSTARQDYEMARFSLGEFATNFLEMHPDYAVETIVAAVEGYAKREQHIPWSDLGDYNLVIAGRNVRLREDWSHIWAQDLYNDDAEALILKLYEHLKSCEEKVVIKLTNCLIDRASLAVFWSRLFTVAAERNDAMLELMIPFALTEQFLMSFDTQGSAINVIAKGYENFELDERTKFEQAVLAFDYSKFTNPEEVKKYFVCRLFSAIGHNAVVTENIQKLLSEDTSQENIKTEKTSATESSLHTKPYRWITDLDRKNPVNERLMKAIDSAKNVLGLNPDTDELALTLNDAHDALYCIERSLSGNGLNPQLKIHGESVISQGCRRILAHSLLPPRSDKNAMKTFLYFLGIATTSVDPEVGDDTESTFESNTSSAYLSTRAEAAQAVLDLVSQRPYLLPELSDQIDALLADPHPAVRLRAGLHLIQIHSLDREKFWECLSARIDQETNLGVLDCLINETLSRLLGVELERTEQQLFCLFERFSGQDERHTHLRETLANTFKILWVKFDHQNARSIISTWIARPAKYHRELLRIMGSMRKAFTVGLRRQKKQGDDDLRQRALELSKEIVDASGKELEVLYAKDTLSDEEKEEFRKLSQLLDTVCLELRFAVSVQSKSREMAA